MVYVSVHSTKIVIYKGSPSCCDFVQKSGLAILVQKNMCTSGSHQEHISTRLGADSDTKNLKFKSGRHAITFGQIRHLFLLYRTEIYGGTEILLPRSM